MNRNEKDKKITVKFFLNQAVEPALGEKGNKSYPLYVQVTYNRKNMQFRSIYGEYYYELGEVKPSLLTFEEKVIKAIVSYEAGKLKGDYDLKGLKKKYEVYSVSILEAVEHYLKPKLKLATQKTKSDLALTLDFGTAHVTTDMLYRASKLLFKDFDTYLTDKQKEDLQAYDYYQKLNRPVLTYNFRAIIDWVNGTYKEALEAKLSDIVKRKPGLYNNITSLIDTAVKQKLKLLEG